MRHVGGLEWSILRSISEVNLRSILRSISEVNPEVSPEVSLYTVIYKIY